MTERESVVISYYCKVFKFSLLALKTSKTNLRAITHFHSLTHMGEEGRKRKDWSITCTYVVLETSCIEMVLVEWNFRSELVLQSRKVDTTALPRDVKGQHWMVSARVGLLMQPHTTACACLYRPRQACQVSGCQSRI